MSGGAARCSVGVKATETRAGVVCHIEVSERERECV